MKHQLMFPVLCRLLVSVSDGRNYGVLHLPSDEESNCAALAMDLWLKFAVREM